MVEVKCLERSAAAMAPACTAVEVDEIRAASAGDFDGVFEAVAVGVAGRGETMRQGEGRQGE